MECPDFAYEAKSNAIKKFFAAYGKTLPGGLEISETVLCCLTVVATCSVAETSTPSIRGTERA